MPKRAHHRAQSADFLFRFAIHVNESASRCDCRSYGGYLFEMRTLAGIGAEQRFRAEDARALGKKKRVQLRREKRRAVAPRIKIEQEPPVRREKTIADIFDKKFPIVGRPFTRSLVVVRTNSVETNSVRRHEVETLAEIGQGDAAIDPSDDAFHIQQFGCAAKERLVIGVETERVVAKNSRDVEKESGAAAKIENLLGGRTIELQILDAFDVGFEPILDVGVLGLVRGGTGVARLDFTQTAAVDPGKKRWQKNGMKLALKTSPGAPVGFALKDFPEFV